MNIKIANRRLIRFSRIVAILILSLSTVSCVKNNDKSSNNTPQPNRRIEKAVPIEKHSGEMGRDSITNNGDKIYDSLDSMPKFPGGESALLEYIGKNTIYPKSALKQGIHGRVIVRFVINKSGKTEKVEAIRSLNPACDREAIRVVKSLPKWIPGKLNGENVSVWFVIPINFRIE